MAEPKEIGTVWTLGCEVFIEDTLTADVQEIKVNDIVLSANIFTEGLSVEVGSDRVNAMDLDVRISMDGLKTYIIDSQIVPYEEVLKITDFSPEATNEKRYASSANTSKKIIDSVGELKGRVNVAEGDIDALGKRVDDLELKGTGGSGDGFWYLNEQDGKIHTDIGIVVHGDAMVEGDTSSGGEGESVLVGVQGISVNDGAVVYPNSEGIVELTISGGGGGGLTSVSWGDIKGTPPSVSTFDNDVPYVDEGTFNSFSEDVNSAISEVSGDIDDLSSLLSSMWHLDENGNLVTDKQVLIKNNLIIDGDTSSGGEGEDTPSGGISGVKVNGVTYYDDNGDGVIDLGTISGGGLGEITSQMITEALGYTPLSTGGGTFNGNFILSSSDYSGALGIQRIGSDYGAGIHYLNSVNGYLGSIGIGGGGSGEKMAFQPIFTSKDWIDYALIHSGNIGSYAMMWLGGAKTGADANNYSYDAGVFGVAAGVNMPTASGYGAILNIPYRVGSGKPDFMGQLMMPNGDEADLSLYYRTSLADSWNAWRKIIATADDGYLYGLGGSIDIQYGDEINRYGGNLYLQHRGGSGAAGSGTGGTTTGHILMCAYGGNVLIGTAVDSGYKLDVYGDSRINGNLVVSGDVASA